MMATTHGLVSLAVGSLAYPVVSEHVGAPAFLVAAFVGGVAPDADLVATHRKTLHYPVGFSVLTAVGAVLLLVAPSTWLVLAVAVVGAAALHACSDVLGGSAERAPWNPTTERGVYNHVRREWHRPRRLVRYSGAPEDVALALPFATVGILASTTGPTVDGAVVAVVAFSAAYALVRKRLGVAGALLAGLLPDRTR